ncbi:MAG: diphosphate--fructose-6-phosphate 1-phosphotransferase, partial [Treponema sp.]|nr:diphosphate--fructose-6-phosphate 1-phosphotransferase [Treponema sp.]
SQIVESICVSINKRAENGDNFGVILIPEGLVEFIPEIKKLIQEINDVLAKHGVEFSRLSSYIDQQYWLSKEISIDSYNVLLTLPPEFARGLLADRDPHGNVQVSRIETEKLLMELVQKRLMKLEEEGVYRGKFSCLGHFFGYEGRCAFPSNFDADYCYSLGFNAFLLIAFGLTGYLSSIKNLTAPASEWIAGGVPLTMMMNMEQRHGSKKPVIKKALVELDGAPFMEFDSKRDIWAVKTCFLYPGAIQYFGPPEVCDEPTKTLKLEHK